MGFDVCLFIVHSMAMLSVSLLCIEGEYHFAGRCFCNVDSFSNLWRDFRLTKSYLLVCALTCVSHDVFIFVDTVGEERFVGQVGFIHVIFP